MSHMALFGGKKDEAPKEGEGKGPTPVPEVRPMDAHSNEAKPVVREEAVAEEAPKGRPEGIHPPAGQVAPKHIAGEGFGRVA